MTVIELTEIEKDYTLHILKERLALIRQTTLALVKKDPFELSQIEQATIIERELVIDIIEKLEGDT